MSTMREHIHKEIHLAAAAHEDSLEKSERKLAEHHRSLHKESGMTDSQESAHSRMAQEHDRKADLHKAYGDHHRASAEKCSKADDATDLNKVAPTQVHVVVPDNPNRLVPRAGMAPVHRPTVPPEFQHLTAVEDDLG